MSKRKVTKGKVTPKLHKIKPKKKKVEFINLSPKRQFVVYRDKKGRVIPEKKVLGIRRLITIEIWRYSEATKRKKRIFTTKKFRVRKRLITKRVLLRMCTLRYKWAKRKVKMINGEVYAYTGSP
jgi:hypothetical protein